MPIRDEIANFIDSLEGVKEAEEYLSQAYKAIAREPELTIPEADKFNIVSVQPSDVDAFRGFLEGEEEKVNCELIDMVNEAFSAHTDIMVHSVDLNTDGGLDIRFFNIEDRDEFILSEEGLWLSPMYEDMKIIHSPHQVLTGPIRFGSVQVDSQDLATLATFRQQLNEKNDDCIKDRILDLAWLRGEPDDTNSRGHLIINFSGMEDANRVIDRGFDWDGDHVDCKIYYQHTRLRQCPKCAKLGHRRWQCRDLSRCLCCAGFHQYYDCVATHSKCVACGGDHPAYLLSCEVKCEEDRRLRRLYDSMPSRYENRSNAIIHDRRAGVPNSAGTGPSDGLGVQRIAEVVSHDAIGQISTHIVQDEQLLAAVLEGGRGRASQEDKQELKRMATFMSITKDSLARLGIFVGTLQATGHVPTFWGTTHAIDVDRVPIDVMRREESL